MMLTQILVKLKYLKRDTLAIVMKDTLESTVNVGYLVV